MAIPVRRPSAGLRSIHRELERRRPKPLVPKRPAAKKPAAPPPPSHGKVLKPSHVLVRENMSSITAMVRSDSDSAQPPPPKRPRRQEVPSCAASRPPPPPSRSVNSSYSAAAGPVSSRPSFAAVSAPPAPPSTSDGAVCAATPGHLKPGMRVLVRTRTQAKIDGKTLVLWLAATVVSATDGGYEVVYEGNLPQEDPFSTVHVPLNHVRPVKASASAPPWQPPSAVAANLSASTINTVAAAPKRMKMLPAARPTTAGKSLGLLHNLALQNASLKHAGADNPTLVAASKTLNLQSAPRSMSPETQHVPRPTTPEKSLRSIRDIAPETKPVSRPTTAGKSIRIVRRILSEMKQRGLDD